MQFTPSVLAAVLPLGVGALQAAAKVGMKSAEEFLSVLRDDSVASKAAPPKYVDSAGNVETRDSVSATNALQIFADGMRSWLRISGVQGPIALDVTVSFQNEITANANGENALQIETLLTDNSHWNDQLRSLVNQFRNAKIEPATDFGHGCSEGPTDRDTLVISVTDDSVSARLV